MTRSEEILALVSGGVVLVWVGLALYVILSRLLHDAQAAAVDRVRGVFERGLREALEGDDVELGRLLQRLPRRTIERVAADTSTPSRIAAAFAEHVLANRLDEIVGRARHGSGRRRWQRIAALRLLARGGAEPALPLLEEALESGDEEIVSAAVSTIGELQDDAASAILVRALRRGSFSRSRIAAQLDSGSRSIDGLLLPLLGDDGPQVRFWGATLLGRYAGDPVVDLELLAATGDVDPSVRAAAVEGLGGARSEACAAGVVALLADPVWFVRAHAARALRRLDRADLVAAVVPLLADESWWVRSAAKEALEAQPAAASAELVAYLGHDDAFARNGAAEVLQNTGALDALIARVVADADPADASLLGRVLAAGGERIALAAAERNGIDRADLDRFALEAR